MRWNPSWNRAEEGAPALRGRRPRPSIERALLPAILALSIAMAGCLGVADGETDPAALEPSSAPDGWVVEQPVSIDLGIGLHVFYVYSHRCAVDFVEVDGPIINVDVTATWDHNVPVVGEDLELTIYNGTTIPQDPHTRFPQGSGIAQKAGPSPLSLDADVAAGNQVGLVVCDWSHVVVRQGFDVHIEGTIRYLASAPGAP